MLWPATHGSWARGTPQDATSGADEDGDGTLVDVGAGRPVGPGNNLPHQCQLLRSHLWRWGREGQNQGVGYRFLYLDKQILLREHNLGYFRVFPTRRVKVARHPTPSSCPSTIQQGWTESRCQHGLDPLGPQVLLLWPVATSLLWLEQKTPHSPTVFDRGLENFDEFLELVLLAEG